MTSRRVRHCGAGRGGARAGGGTPGRHFRRRGRSRLDAGRRLRAETRGQHAGDRGCCGAAAPAPLARDRGVAPEAAALSPLRTRPRPPVLTARAARGSSTVSAAGRSARAPSSSASPPARSGPSGVGSPSSPSLRSPRPASPPWPDAGGGGRSGNSCALGTRAAGRGRPRGRGARGGGRERGAGPGRLCPNPSSSFRPPPSPAAPPWADAPVTLAGDARGTPEARWPRLSAIPFF